MLSLVPLYQRLVGSFSQDPKHRFDIERTCILEPSFKLTDCHATLKSVNTKVGKHLEKFPSEDVSWIVDLVHQVRKTVI